MTVKCISFDNALDNLCGACDADALQVAGICEELTKPITKVSNREVRPEPEMRPARIRSPVGGSEVLQKLSVDRREAGRLWL